MRDNKKQEAKMIETEAKIRIANIREIRKRLVSLGAEFMRKEHEINDIYDFSGNELVKNGMLLRLRNKHLLTFKGPLQDSIFRKRLEKEFEIGNVKSLLNFFKKIGLRKVFSYPKIREEYRVADALICLDFLSGLGSFVEIEADEWKIQNAIRLLGLNNADAVKESYQELYQKNESSFYRRAGNRQDNSCL